MADNITLARTLKITVSEKETSLPDESKVISITNRKILSGSVISTDGQVTLDIPASPKYIEFRNKGSAAITYRLSGSLTDTGSIAAGGILILADVTLSGFNIATASNQAVAYEVITGE
jgi:hypothetical protein